MPFFKHSCFFPPGLQRQHRAIRWWGAASDLDRNAGVGQETGHVFYWVHLLKKIAMFDDIVVSYDDVIYDLYLIGQLWLLLSIGFIGTLLDHWKSMIKQREYDLCNVLPWVYWRILWFDVSPFCCWMVIRWSMHPFKHQTEPGQGQGHTLVPKSSKNINLTLQIRSSSIIFLDSNQFFIKISYQNHIL